MLPSLSMGLPCHQTVVYRTPYSGLWVSSEGKLLSLSTITYQIVHLNLPLKENPICHL